MAYNIFESKQLKRKKWFIVNNSLTYKFHNAIMIIQEKEDDVMYAMDFAQVGANIQNKLVEKEMTQQSLADALIRMETK